jgi:anti-sigma B factor antagonist
MFGITVDAKGDVIMRGRLDATQTDTANAVLDALSATTRIDFSALDYISSAGLGVLLKTQKRLSSSGHQLVLTGVNNIVADVFRVARFDLVFRIEESA